MDPTKRRSWTRGLVLVGWAAAACGGGEERATPEVSVSISPTSAEVKIDESRSFTATVSGSSDQAVTWQLSGAGCSGAACGTITGDGVYTAPGVVPVPPSVAVTAAAHADSSKLAAAAVTVVSGVDVSVWPASARVKTNDSYQFTHTLTGSTGTSVTWSLSGAGCTDAECGIIDGSGLYTAPTGVPSSPTVLVHATSVVDPSVSATASVLLGATYESKLSGGYAYLSQGFWNGLPGHLAGRFTADGAGGISEGVVDRTVDASLGGNLIAEPHTGMYFMWTQNRGTLSMSFSFGSVYSMHTVTTSGDKGNFQPFYDGNVRGIATFMKQDPSAFTVAAIAGDYVLSWTGSDSQGNRVAQIGRFAADGAGHITGGQLDRSGGEAVTFDGSYTVGQNGRGTLQLGQLQFVFYVVSAETLLVSSSDEPGPGKPMLLGPALRQSGGPFSSASLQGKHLLSLTGRDSSSAAVALAGLASSDGAGELSGIFDRNADGVVTTAQPFSASYSIAATGRGMLDSTGLRPLIFYMVRPDLALVMETAGGALLTGSLERQAAVPYVNSTLVGHYAQASSPPALVPSVTVTAQVWFAGSGAVSATGDIASPCSLVNTALSSGTFTVQESGRFDVLDPGGARLGGGYMLSPLRHFLVLERPSVDPTCDEVVHLYTAER